MRKTSETIIFFGNEQLATGVSTSAPVLRALIGDGYNIKHMVISQSKKTSHIKADDQTALLAKEHDINVLAPGRIEDISNLLVEAAPRVGILVAYGQLIPRYILDIFPLGIINLHPSLLPLHRGPTPIESAILSGEQKSGVSIIQLGEKMDAGPIFAQAETTLEAKITKQELADRLGELGAKMIAELLPDILNESLEALPQDDNSATYDKLISKTDGQINWSKPAVQIEREIRAYAGWPGSFTELSGINLTILKADENKTQSKPGQVIIRDKNLFVGCGEGSLKIELLRPAGRNKMSARDFLLGYGSKFN